jgi:photosystem II stability/assembly factor-like uncharacterized protein
MQLALPLQSNLSPHRDLAYLPLRGLVPYTIAVVTLLCTHGQAQIQPIATPVAQNAAPQPRSNGAMASPTLGSQPKGTIQQQIVKQSRGDAALRDIVALSADRLCAVGDCGTILVTNNAGRTWELKDSQTELNLYAVQFSDSENGVAVGGGLGNYSGISRAVILRTTDGGASWESVENDLPCLRGLTQSVSPTPGGRLIAWGDFDPRRNSGIFVSQDRGQSWTSPTTPLSRARAVAQLDPVANRLFVIDDEQRSGQIDLLNPAESRIAGPTPMQSQSSGQQTRPASPITSSKLHFLHHTGRLLLACGRGGMLKSSPHGTTWRDVELPFSELARSMCTLERITQRGPNVWICGTPGSLIFHSPDFGETWRALRTGETLPLNQVVFLDERRGWAVGPFGRILATRDGGRSWYRQRGLSKAGMLCITSKAKSVPWETLAASAWEAQSATVALLDAEVDSRSKIPASLEQRTRDASSRFGVHLAERTPAAHSSSMQSLQVTLATWNPDVVLSPPVQANILLTMLESNSLPGDEILNELGLPTPSIKKVLTPSNREMAHFQQTKSRVLNRIGLSGLDLLLPLPPHQLASTEPSYFRTVWSASNNTASRSSLFGGVAENPASSRDSLQDGLGNYPLVMGRASRSQLVSEIMESQQNEAIWTRDLDFVIRQLPADEQAPALWRLYHAFATVDSNWKRQAVLDRMLTSRTDFDAKVWAMMTRLQTAASDEVQGLIRQLQADMRSRANLQNSVVMAAGQSSIGATTPWNASPFESGSEQAPANSGQTVAGQSSASIPFSPAVVPASGVITAAPTPSKKTSNALRTQVLNWFELVGTYSKFEPRLLGVPGIRMIEHRISRLTPAALEVQAAPAAGTRLKSLVKLSTLSNWSEAAIHELYFEQKMYDKTRRLGLASFAPEPPRLDGILDEKSWEQATPLPLQIGDTSQRLDEPPRTDKRPTDVRLRFMHDDAYVYLGIECSSSGQTLPPPSESRQYDALLGSLDHVKVWIDTDRDYSTAYQFAVAANGETYDRCHDFVDFNPKWYVQVAQRSDQSWTAEIAIQRKSAFFHGSSAESPRSVGAYNQSKLDGQVWAVSASRFSAGKLRSSTDEGEDYHRTDGTDFRGPKERPYYVLFEPKPSSDTETPEHPTTRTPSQPPALPENPPQRISSTQRLNSN